MRGLITITLLSTLTTAALAQPGQVVQLPSISTFYYSGTVLVPDSGTGFLGGNRSSASQTIRGRGWGSGIGSSQSASQATVTATIIDLAEMDRAILDGTPRQLLQAHRADEDTHDQDPDHDGKAIVRYARKQYRAGNLAAAFRGYRAAIGMLSPSLSDLAAAEFKRVFGPAADQALRMSSLRR